MDRETKAAQTRETMRARVKYANYLSRLHAHILHCDKCRESYESRLRAMAQQEREAHFYAQGGGLFEDLLAQSMDNILPSGTVQ